MRNLQFFQDLKLTEHFSKRISEVKKHSTVTTILFICLTALVIFKLKNSNQILFQPSPNPTCSEKFARNVTGEQNNTSKGDANTRNIPVNPEKGLFEELAPLFNKESCLSRFQHSSYRKNQPYNPSPYLISKLRAYQDLHSRCGPRTLSYKRAIRKLSTPSSNTSTDPAQCRYLVWTQANGLGNRIVSITSAFLYAILQSRVLLVEFHPEMDDLFCEPFPNSTWLFPKSFPLTHNWTNIIPSFKEQVISKPVYFLNLQHGNGDFSIQHFQCNETQSLLQNIPVLVLRSDQYFVPSLFLTPFFNQELNKMFPLKGSVFHLLGRYLFNPSNSAWGLVTRFYQAYLSKSDMKIGLQIRVFSVNNKINYEQIMKQILSCILPNHILPSFNSISKNVSLSQNSTAISKAVLVSSLYPQFSEQLRNMYWIRPTLTGEVIGVYQPSHEEFQKFGDNMHNMKAWAEMYLLSLCDVVVTSGQSTFGYVAQGLGGLKPWILDKLDGTNTRNASCKRGVSSEPCFHIAPTNDCSGNKIGNVTAVNSNMRQCEDIWWGIKLVD